VLAFAVSADSEKLLTRTFSDRLMRDFAARRFRADRSAVTMLVTIIAGADDELIFSDKFVEMVHVLAFSIDVKGVGGMAGSR